MSDTVNVAEGTLRGKKATSKSGGSYYSFQGVPYVKSPVGALRFKDPQPLEPWSGVRDALTEGSSCTQYNDFTGNWEGTEDCLFLNVYTPELPSSGSTDLKPVMVYIHGGGFNFGSSTTDFLGPDFLVDEGVVLVTLNYRLGILGFLNLNVTTAPGNVGLKDQVAALRWVQKNISKFGGDPGNVTLFGESAGGASVLYHMLSPMSKGLFHKAIAQSGSVVNAWSFRKQPEDMAFRVGKALGYTGQKPEELVEFLRGIDSKTLTEAARTHARSMEDKERLIYLGFVPTPEGDIPGVEKFLPDNPIQLLDQGRYHDVPYITGVTSQEGLVLFGFQDLKNEETLARINQNFDKSILPELRRRANDKKRGDIITKVKNFYFKGNPVSPQTLPGLFDIISDIMLVEGAHYTTKKMAQLNKAPLYYYLFSYDGPLNYFKANTGYDIAGASHIDDLGHLFRTKEVDLDLPPEDPAAITRARMVKMWTNFAKTGNPTPEKDNLLTVKWEPYTATNPCYLDIDEELSMKKNMFDSRMKFWEELYSSGMFI